MKNSRPHSENAPGQNRKPPRRRGPVEVRRRKGLYRVFIEGTQQLARNPSGTPIDGGGHVSDIAARRQVRTVNRNLYKKGIIV